MVLTFTFISQRPEGDCEYLRMVLGICVLHTFTFQWENVTPALEYELHDIKDYMYLLPLFS